MNIRQCKDLWSQIGKPFVCNVVQPMKSGAVSQRPLKQGSHLTALVVPAQLWALAAGALACNTPLPCADQMSAAPACSVALLPAAPALAAPAVLTVQDGGAKCSWTTRWTTGTRGRT